MHPDKLKALLFKDFRADMEHDIPFDTYTDVRKSVVGNRVEFNKTRNGLSSHRHMAIEARQKKKGAVF